MKFTDDDLVFIKPSLVIEPLFDNWYAWPHLISPATAAMNIHGRHLTIMESFLKYPELHEEAVKNPKMLGGPFVDQPVSRVHEVKELVENTKTKCANLLNLRLDILYLFELLKKENGHSLNDLYDKLPKSLDGVVELFYDINNNASFRFFESLLYKTEFYNESLQSFNLFLMKNDDSRSFVLSTPFLPTPEKLRINMPMKSNEIDTLFEMARTPQPYGTIKSLFNLEGMEKELFDTFFTKEAPNVYKRYEGDGILTRYFGHACILVETKHTTILADPLISYGYDSDISRFTYEDLPEEIDYAVITHNHQDHILLETLLRIRSKIKNIVIPKNSGGTLQDPSLKLMFKQLGFNNVIELGEMETIEFEDCTITGLPFLGEHSDLDVRSKLCHHVRFKDNKSMLFAADSCNVSPSLYNRIQTIVGDIDVIFLGMECHGAPLSWLYGPLMPKPLSREMDQSRRLAGCDFKQARALIDTFNPKNVFVYAMGLEPWLQYISSIKYNEQSKPIVESNKLLDYCNQKAIESERLYGEKVIEYKKEFISELEK